MNGNQLSINQLYFQIFKIWRRKRFQLFIRRLSPRRDHHLLDVGGTPGFWANHPAILGGIHTVNVYPLQWDSASSPEHNIRTSVGDGCSLGFADRSYDIAFSNSVIEHVGSWERQQAFAREIRRVGRAVWVQTPAFECPLEPHYLAPCIHWLPKGVQQKLIRWFTLRGWLEKPSADAIREMVQTTRLLRKREMRLLFPDCEIHTEYLLGFIPKSYVAIRMRNN